MPQPHAEKHSVSSETVRDVVLGMADGLTVPFALAAGLSGAVQTTGLIVTAGLAEIAAGSIAMGLGGYLAARGDAEFYASEEARERSEVAERPKAEEAEIHDVFKHYGLTEAEIRPLVAGLRRNPKAWVDFMMRFELDLTPPQPGRALRSAFAIGFSYIAGGLVPLTPYFFIRQPLHALAVSAGVTAIALFAFGWAKARFTGVPSFRSGWQTLLVGSAAACAAYSLAKIVGAGG